MRLSIFTSTLFMAMAFVTVAEAQNGNGAPSGSHYNLNVIGVPKGKTADMTGSSGHRIFVWESGKSKINLKEGSSFQVLDANGTDGNGASFQLPNPDADGDGITIYSIYARALGKPGGSSTTTTCFTELDIDYCSTESLVMVRSGGKSTFTNVSKTLLTIYADLDGDGDLERESLFARDADYYWDYLNNGLKLLQLRFYPVSSDVN